MVGKRSITVVFLLLSMISFSNAEPPFETLHQTAASNPDSVSYSDAQLNGSILSMEMLHRELIFPSAEEEMSRGEIMKIRLNRDRKRVASLSSRATTANGTVISGLSMGSGEYFARLAVGTPPQHFYMELDTGSDVTWLQCDPCIQCYKPTDPIFNRTSSTTYRGLSCDSKTCNLLDNSGCNMGICQYQILYGDGSYNIGDFANETVTLGNNINVAGIALGFGHYYQGNFSTADGILGLGRGNLSFPNQLGSQQYSRQFSYCLVSRGSSDNSTITFGQTPLWSKTKFTPMLTNKEMDPFYYVNLTGISVGGYQVQGVNSSISDIPGNGIGGVIIDLSTVITRLEKSAYIAVRDAFRKATDKLNHMWMPPPADYEDIFDTCYYFSVSVVNNVSMPTVVLHFADGANMQLRPDNCLVSVVSVDESGFCFAFAPSDDVSIIGNTQQQGFGIVFDLETMLIGIAPESC